MPFGALHYVPFQALHSGRRHLIEEVEVCVAPSAGVLLFCLEQARSRPQRVVLIGAPDERTPLLEREIAALHELIPTAEVRVGEDGNAGSGAQPWRQKPTCCTWRVTASFGRTTPCFRRCTWPTAG